MDDENAASHRCVVAVGVGAFIGLLARVGAKVRLHFFGGITLKQQEQQLLLPPHVQVGEYEAGGMAAVSAKEKNSVGTMTKDCFLVWRI